MRLVSAYCKGYRRFLEKADINLDPRLVCIVGPNAAGKSSLLRALAVLTDFSVTDFDPVDRTRSHPNERTDVAARYELDDSDREQLEEIPEARNATHLNLRMSSGSSQRAVYLEPTPVRDRAPRLALARKLEALRKSVWVRDRTHQEMSDGREVTDALLERLVSELQEAVDSMSDQALADLQELASRLSTAGEGFKRVREVQAATQSRLDVESAGHPHNEAVDILVDRIPRFVEFHESLRQLAATYNVDEAPDQAIQNVLELAGTSWSELRAAIDSDAGRRKTWVDRADRAAQAKLAEWTQQGAELKLSFGLNERALTLLMKMTGDEYIAIDQHSDGLRQFIALRSLIELRELDVDPVVLIDEADIHLHYDAQADLVRVLESAQGVSKVIYTTHSAGCLPHDLGTGVRAVVPVFEGEETERRLTDFSRIENRFWTHGEGFSPLLIAMGASAFAFSATQRAAVTEGISDAMLLPSMIRDALKVDQLPYQMVPGYAEASGDAVAQFDLMASRTAFVADGNTGGEEHAEKLTNKGVSPKQISYLGGKGSGLSTEDLLVKDVYLTAVNEVLSSISPTLKIPESEIGSIGRAKAVDAWAAQRRVKGRAVRVRKAAVAQRVLDRRAPGKSLVTPESSKLLRSLHRALVKTMATPTQQL